MFSDNNLTNEQKEEILTNVVEMRSTLYSISHMLADNIQNTLDICRDSHIKMPGEDKLVKILHDLQLSESHFFNQAMKLSDMVEFFKEENRDRVYTKKDIPKTIRWWE